MGWLTNPDTNRPNGYTTLFKCHYLKIAWISYVAGIIFFFVMAYSEYNALTYFSENALLPGLVTAEFNEERLTRRYLAEYNAKFDNNDDEELLSWIESRFREINLETYTHNFRLNYPTSNNFTTGRNIFTIIRAPRASSTEAMVITAPFRGHQSLERGTGGSIALMLALANFFQRQNYWAKDIIFLVCQNEQLGALAWLEAYHQITFGLPGTLIHGDLEARAGAIQAAVNLEFSKEQFTHVNIRIGGLDGQLPNLDLVNLVKRLCAREAVSVLYHGVAEVSNSKYIRQYMRSLKTLSNMVLSQASGVATGNHGLFLSFGIEAMSIEGVYRKNKVIKGFTADFRILGRIMEGIYRSLNNLLERFHQSFFFYLLPSCNRYVSIGMYMPGVGLFVSSLSVCGLALFLIVKEELGSDTKDLRHQLEEDVISTSTELFSSFSILIFSHFGGIVASFSPYLLKSSSSDSAAVFYYLISCLLLMAVSLPLIVQFITVSTWKILKCLMMFEMVFLGSVVSLVNFSLSYLMLTAYIPIALIAGPSSSGWKILIKGFVSLLIHPLSLLFIACWIDIVRINPDETSVFVNFNRALNSTENALISSMVHQQIYGSINFNLATTFLVPCWTTLWSLNFFPKLDEEKKLKSD